MRLGRISVPRAASSLLGTIAFAAGLAALVGWSLDSQRLQALLTDAPPFGGDLALSSMAASVALIALAFGRRRLAIGASALAAILGLSAWIGSLTSMPPLHDALFGPPVPEVGALTAASFLALAVAIGFRASSPGSRVGGWLARAGAAVAAVGAILSIGKAVQAGPFTGFPILAAIVVIILATGIETMADTNSDRVPDQATDAVTSADARAESGSPDDLRAAMVSIMATIGEAAGWSVGEAWLPDDADDRLYLAATWDPDPPSGGERPITAAGRALRLAKGEGLPGQVWEAGAMIWLDDTADPKRFVRAMVAADSGLHAAAGIPFRGDEGTVAVLVFFSEHPRAEDASALGIVDALSDELSRISMRLAETEALAHARTRYATLVDSAEDYEILSLDATGRITSSSGGAAPDSELSDSTAVGQRFSIYFPEEARNTGAPEAMLRTAAAEGRASADGWTLRADGSRYWGRMTCSAMREPGGTLRGFTFVVRDLTDRREAEIVRGELAAIVRSSTDAIIGTSPDAMITSWNDGATAMLGHDEAEMIGRHLGTLAPPEEMSEFRGVIERLAKGQAVAPFDTTVLGSSGRRLSVSMTISPATESDGTVVGWAAILRDISARVEREAALRRARDELAQSNEHLEEFAAVASHDLQAPLRVVAGFATLLDRKYGDRIDAEGHELIQFIVEGAARMQSLIQDLLAFSRVGTEPRSPEQIGLTEVVEEVRATLSRDLHEVGGRLDVGPLPTVEGDRSQLARLLQNLIANSIKYRGDVPLTIKVDAELQDDTWQIAVRDNGIGFDAKYAERIFEIFQRLHTRDAYPGSGVGLAVCRRILERHDGRIWAEGVDGKGATFTFTLPADPMAAPEKES